MRKRLFALCVSLLLTIWSAATLAVPAPTQSADSATDARKSTKEQKEQAKADAKRAKDTAKQEKERLERERHFAEDEAKSAQDTADILKEADAQLTELALALLARKYDDRFLQQYVNELGQNMVPREVPSGVMFSFRVIDDPVPNALALPDGRIFINSGLLAFVQNEAQLAMVIGHEIGHVLENHYVESVKHARSAKVKSEALSVGIGIAAGALTGGKSGAVIGGIAGAAAGLLIAKARIDNFSREQEDEADRIGTRLALDAGFDSKESVSLFQKLMDTYGDRDRFGNALWGRHSRNSERISNSRTILESGDLFERYNNARAAGTLTVGSGQLARYASRMIRDTAIRLMDDEDRYIVAKGLLDKIEQFRPRDPKMLWALGRVYMLVGRSPEDKTKALDCLQRAVRSDERKLYAFTRRDLGLMQARLEQPGEAAESLRNYVMVYVAQTGTYPPDLDEIYDYLLTFGDGKWTAPRVDALVTENVTQSDSTPTLKAPMPPAPAVAAPAPKPDPKRALRPSTAPPVTPRSQAPR